MTEFINQIGVVGNSLVIIVSITCLYYGADWLVNGGSAVSSRFGVPPFVVGLTVVAFGTSLPEFVVSFVANIFGDSPTIAIGNIIGSNITNVGLILGLSALILPIAIPFSNILKQLIFLFLMGSLLFAFSLDGLVNRFEGAVLIILLIGYVIYLYRHPEQAETEDTAEKTDINLIGSITLIIIGIVILSGGAWLFVESGKWFAVKLGVSELVIGLTIMAVGTSLPELATSVVAAMKRRGDISIGNIVGSNIFNILFIMGGVSLFKPLSVLETKIVDGTQVTYFPYYQYLSMVLFGLVLIPMTIKSKLDRISGAILIMGYLAFYTYLFLEH